MVLENNDRYSIYGFLRFSEYYTVLRTLDTNDRPTKAIFKVDI